MTKNADVLLECSKELYRLAKEAKSTRWKKELLARAVEIGETEESTQAVISLKNLAVVASNILLEMAI